MPICRSIFNRCMSLTSVILPDTAIELAPNAFHNCSGLVCITAPERYLTARYFPHTSPAALRTPVPVSDYVLK